MEGGLGNLQGSHFLLRRVVEDFSFTKEETIVLAQKREAEHHENPLRIFPYLAAGQWR